MSILDRYLTIINESEENNIIEISGRGAAEQKLPKYSIGDIVTGIGKNMRSVKGSDLTMEDLIDAIKSYPVKIKIKDNKIIGVSYK